MESGFDKHYILVGKEHKVVSLLEWAEFMENGDRAVAKTQIGVVSISTVFLGIDHGWGEGEPVLYETMIFGGDFDSYQTRSCTWEEAEEAHKEAVSLVVQRMSL